MTAAPVPRSTTTMRSAPSSGSVALIELLEGERARVHAVMRG